MTSPLTPQQLADVAREVNPDKEIIVHKNLPYLDGHMLWTPRFDHCHQCRSQALQMVEWLADRIEKLPAGHRRFSMMDGFLIAINKRDTTALQRMVIELKGAAQ